MAIPSDATLQQPKKSVQLSLSFSHPFEKVGMDMEKPQGFYVVKDGERSDLITSLTPATVMDHKAWQADYPIKRPGVYHFVVEPSPYWEPAEDVSIIHYTKTVVAAFGADGGWDSPVGLPTEIVPLLRPFGNYAGNTFSGQVLVAGKPLAGAEVEVEYYNREGQLTAPSEYHVTQVVKADDNGVFNFSCPVAGWWGFAALSEAEYTLEDPEGNAKGVELGAVLWIYLDPVQNR
jgi:cobalt/nickel transport protein